MSSTLPRPPRAARRIVGLVGASATVAGSAAALALSAGPAAGTTTLVVDSLADGAADATHCTNVATGDCTLRDALAAAQDGDTITFSVGSGSTLTMAPINGQFVIDHAITIAGPGRTDLTIDGLNQTRVFSVLQTVTGDVTLSGLTITHGNSGGADGGGLNTRNRGTTTFRDLGVVSNRSIGGAGGLSAALAENVVMDRVVLEGNTGGNGGAYVGASTAITITGLSALGNTGNGTAGAMFARSYGSLTITDSTFDANIGQTAGLWTSVGSADPGALTITDSTFSNNVGGDNGGLSVFATNRAVTIANTTITGNQAGTGGAGMRLYLNDSSATLAQLTVTGNTLTGTTTGNYYGGGGLFLYGGQGTNSATIIGSIIAGNTNSVFHDIDFHKYDGNSSLSVTIDHSLIGTTGTAGPATVTPVDGGGNTFGVTDPGVNALANNGGPTRTMSLKANSPALGAGPTTVATFPGNQFDQRGIGFARVVNGRVDIGAFEDQTVTPVEPMKPAFTG